MALYTNYVQSVATRFYERMGTPMLFSEVDDRDGLVPDEPDSEEFAEGFEIVEDPNEDYEMEDPDAGDFDEDDFGDDDFDEDETDDD